MEHKKVAVVVKYFPTVSETFIVNQINALIDSGVEVKLFAYKKSPNSIIHQSLNKHALLDKVQYFKNPPKSKIKRFLAFLKWIVRHFFDIRWALFFKSINVFKHGKDAYSLKLFFESQWFLLPYEFSLIHAHFGMNGNRIAYLKEKGFIPQNIKLITTFHGYDLIPKILPKYKLKYSYLLRHADAFTVNTPYLESLLTQVNTNKKPVYKLPVGLDTSFFNRNEAKMDNGYFDMVFCGKLFPLKGPDLAVDIVRRLHSLGHNQVRLHVIGEGELKSHLRQKIRDSHLENFIFLHGNLEQEAVRMYFQASDMFILPGRTEESTGRSETQGLVIQEAQAMHLPVVVSDVGGMKYGLNPDVSGFVVKTQDVDGFVAVIERLIQNPKLKLDMGEAARKFSEQYDNKVLVKELQQIYSSVV